MSELASELESVKGDWAVALGKVIAHYRAESGTVHLLGSDGTLHLQVSQGIPEFALDRFRVVPIGKGMAGLAAERKHAVTICNIQTDGSGDVRPGAKLTGMEGAIALPMLEGEEVVGVLGVANRGERTFTAEEEAGLIAAGRILAGWR